MSTDALPLPELSELPDDPQLLRTLVLQLLEALRGERAQREQLEHRLDLVLRKLYGRSSEKVDPNQLPLFDSSLECGGRAARGGSQRAASTPRRPRASSQAGSFPASGRGT